jgi:hypothetical protein
VRGETAAQFAASVDAARVAPPVEDDDDFAMLPVARDGFRRATVATGEVA